MLERVSAAVAIVLTAAVAVGAQTPAKAPARTSTKTYVPPKTPWGDPDLQGNFTNKYEQGTPFERPAEFEGKRIEDIQGKELEALIQRRQQTAIERAPFLSGDPTGTIAGPMEFRDIYEVSKASRPWFVVDPPDGKIPPVTPEGQKRIAARPRTGSSFSNGVYASYEDLGLYDRCITRGYPDSMLPAIYGDSYQFIQGPGWVAIRNEMIHETRVIPLDRTRRTSASRSAWTWATPAAIGTATRSSSRRRTSRTRSVVSQREPGDAAADRTLHADRSRHDGMVGDRGRSDDVDQAVDVLDAPDQKRPGAGVRVRVPRGQLRDDATS